MHLSGKSTLLAFCSLLLCLSISAQIRLFEGAYSSSSSLESQAGFYVPFAAFALVSAYHFFEWAKKHRFQAILLMICLVAFASLLGVATLKVQYSPSVNSGQAPPITMPSSGQMPAELPILQQNLQKLGQSINSVPYVSTALGAIEIGMSAVAVIIILLKSHYAHPKRNAIQSAGASRAFNIARRKSPTTFRDTIIEEYLTTIGSFKNRGLNIPDSDTPHNTMQRVKKTWPEYSEPLKSLTTLYEEAKFSLHQVGHSHVRAASQLRISMTANV